jgi:hypothetical protein
MSVSARPVFVSAIVLASWIGAAGCGSEEVKYQPRPANKGTKVDLPPVPNVPQKPIKAGDAYTVWGASYSLRSPVHHKEVVEKKLSITGYITKSNLGTAPECAVHKGGKADPEGCTAPIPAFWIGDTKDATEKDSIKVMGWASNYAQIYDAIEEFDKGKEDAEHLDEFWGVKTPNPLPAVGAKITVTGKYSTVFSGASTGAEADPIMGLVSYESITVHEPAAEVATLPGVKRKPPKP